MSLSRDEALVLLRAAQAGAFLPEVERYDRGEGAIPGVFVEAFSALLGRPVDAEEVKAKVYGVPARGARIVAAALRHANRTTRRLG